METAALCDFGGATYWLFSSNVPPLIYYTHVTALILSLFIGMFVFFKNRRALLNKILFWSLVPFLLWVFFNIMIWATNRSDIIMFLWSLQIMIEPLTYIGMAYLVYVFINKKDAGTKTKVAIAIVYLPLILITPTSYSLSGFLLSLCIPDENPYAYYTYVLELSSIIFIIFYTVKNYLQKSSSSHFKKEIIYLSTGTVLFLLTFASGNIFGSLTDDWVTSQFGLFGTPVFVAFISYLIVKFKFFNVRLLGAQALVIALWISTLSLLFIRKVEILNIVIIATLGMVTIFGILLVRSVKRQVEQREHIEKLAKDLSRANKRLKELDELKSEFMSLATHQIRSPLTAIKGYASLMLEEDYGKLPAAAIDPLKVIYKSCDTLVKIVGEFLDISRIEQGRMKYERVNFDFKKLVEETTHEFKPTIDNSGLEFRLMIAPGDYKTTGDVIKLKQVINNLIDNALKYTKQGSVSVNLERHDNMIRLKVADTGIGLSQENISKLFSKFTRMRNAAKSDVMGTGLGLYVAKEIVEGHHGKIWVESDGEGKGATFIAELPMK